MTRLRSRRLWVSAALVAATLAIYPIQADAENKQALIVPFDGTLAAPLADAPARLSEELEAIIAEDDLSLVVAKIARKELTAIAGCSDDTQECMSTIAETMSVEIVALGSVEAASDGSLTATLTVYTAKDGLRRGTLKLEAKDIDDLVGEFGTKARAWLNSKPDAPAEADVPVAAPTAASVLPPVAGPRQPASAAFAFGRVQPYSYAIAGGGIALVGLGAIFYALASSKQNSIDDHPTDTLQQLQALSDLESSAKTYATLGNLGTVVGGAAAAAGVALIVLQGTKRETQPTAQLAPVAMAHGFGLSLTLRGDL